MLKTEMRNPKTAHLDRMTTAEMLRVIQDENYNAVKAVDGCLDALERAVDAERRQDREGGIGDVRPFGADRASGREHADRL